MPIPHLSVSLPYWQDRDPRDALLVADAAARLGYDRLWIGEMATYDAFALATAIGLAPGDLPLCLGPLAVSIRTPATIAMGVASVAALTGRRTDIALGTSSTVVVEDWHGRERRRTAAHLEDSVHIVRALLHGGRTDFDGTAEHSHGYRLRLPAPHTSPASAAGAGSPAPPWAGGEVAVAAFGERALSVAGRVADRAVLNLVTPAQVQQCASVIREFAARAGRPAPPISVWVTAAADPTADLLATVRRGVVGYLNAPGYDAMFRAAGFDDVVRLAHSGSHPREVLAAVPDELLAAVGMFGDIATLADRLAAYRAAGADEVVVVPATSADDPAGAHTLEALATLRAATGFDLDRVEVGNAHG
ncbi:LLM class F420-dependent oxidoreductase [Nocardia huaxiensis]|uniref:LLM class F420-dependent oxidoreductase n=1 Tax=Nocardia huaxiensis TaxID=2755382 RepID=UPI001FD2F2BF|nr:LLM class F420-dependent oxidoreductase [Nocardia huaxiensis]